MTKERVQAEMKVVVSPGTMKADSFPTGRYSLCGRVGGSGSSSLMEVGEWEKEKAEEQIKEEI